MTIQCKCKCPKCDKDPSCQLTLKNDKITCKKEAGTLCRNSVALWAAAYRNAENANDPRCKKDDPNYIASQQASASCHKGNN